MVSTSCWYYQLRELFAIYLTLYCFFSLDFLGTIFWQIVELQHLPGTCYVVLLRQVRARYRYGLFTAPALRMCHLLPALWIAAHTKTVLCTLSLNGSFSACHSWISLGIWWICSRNEYFRAYPIRTDVCKHACF